MRKMMLVLPILMVGCIIHPRQERIVIPATDPFSVEELIALDRGGATPASIEQELATHGMEHTLTADDIIALKEAGVSEETIRRAIHTPVKSPRESRVIVTQRGREHRGFDTCSHHNDSAIFTLGALFGWALSGGHGSHSHSYSGGYRSRW